MSKPPIILSFKGNRDRAWGSTSFFCAEMRSIGRRKSLPQMAKILAERHGFKCTVLFAIDPADGTINPNITTNMPGAEALDSADAIVMALRFREWPDAQMKHFVDAYLAGKPIIALRTSTHAFNLRTIQRVLTRSIVGTRRSGRAVSANRCWAKRGWRTTGRTRRRQRAGSSTIGSERSDFRGVSRFVWEYRCLYGESAGRREDTGATARCWPG